MDTGEKLTHSLELADNVDVDQLRRVVASISSIEDLLDRTTVEAEDGRHSPVVSPMRAADILGVDTETLGKWRGLSRRHGDYFGPRYMTFRVGTRDFVVYALSDLLTFMRDNFDYPEWDTDSVGSHFSKSGSSPPNGRAGGNGGAA
ncbi:MAG: hypothetical protein KDJ27_19140 [Gammaproteobacteria bacterium]|nr:hypothetical protein [Gammaproteobacteria bacterium]